MKTILLFVSIAALTGCTHKHKTQIVREEAPPAPEYVRGVTGLYLSGDVWLGPVSLFLGPDFPIPADRYIYKWKTREGVTVIIGGMTVPTFEMVGGWYECGQLYIDETKLMTVLPVEYLAIADLPGLLGLDGTLTLNVDGVLKYSRNDRVQIGGEVIR